MDPPVLRRRAHLLQGPEEALKALRRRRRRSAAVALAAWLLCAGALLAAQSRLRPCASMAMTAPARPGHAGAASVRRRRFALIAAKREAIGHGRLDVERICPPDQLPARGHTFEAAPARPPDRPRPPRFAP
ncbi:hypothetical protein ACRAWD_24295 [Caulobacter segnis]